MSTVGDRYNFSLVIFETSLDLLSIFRSRVLLTCHCIRSCVAVFSTKSQEILNLAENMSVIPHILDCSVKFGQPAQDGPS